MLAKIVCGIMMTLFISSDIAMGKDMPAGKWWHFPRLSEQLDLTQGEKQRLDERFRESRRKLIDLKSKLERERFELENLLENETLDEPAIMEQFKKLENARSSLARERFAFLIEVRKILGLERFQRIKLFYTKWRQHGMRQVPPKMERLPPRK